MVKINELQIENVKRIRAVHLEPSAGGLTIIGGRNNQGKTSVLDSIAWALGGEKYRPEAATRDGSVIPPRLHVALSNGLIVERGGKNAALKVTDLHGNKGGQQLLNEFVEQLALDLPKFMQATDKEKADTLLKIIGVGEELARLTREEREAYNRRLAIGQIADQKEKYAKELPYYGDAPENLVPASELIRQQQDILAQNGENARKRSRRDELARMSAQLEERLTALLAEKRRVDADLAIAQSDALDLRDQSTEALEQNIRDIEEINRKVRVNLDRGKAQEDADEYRKQYDALTIDIGKLRNAKTALLDGADLPLPGLSVEDGALTYNGKKWSDMSGSDHLRVATAIVRRLNPQCGFVLLDKLEQMDMDTLREFGAWLSAEGLQAIATRVSTGDECSIVIEDGYVQGEQMPVEPAPWKEGEF